MGALIAGVYSAGKLDDFKKWALNLTRSDVYRLVDFTMNLGFVKMDRVFDELRALVGTWQLKDLRIPISIIAADINAKEEVVFEKGRLFDAIRASVAYPTVITPIEIDGQLLVDGGIVNPLPVNRVKRNEGDMMVAVDLSAGFDYEALPRFKNNNEEPNNVTFSIVKSIISKWRSEPNDKESLRSRWTYLKVIDESLNMMHRKLAQMSLQLTPPQILISISQDAAGLFDYYRAEELIEYGREQAIKSIGIWEEKQSNM
jgi:NTE family protein